ncbi:filamentous hemagglutinin N-terminal domain-containing protein [Duganella sp. CY15W]|uniref:beta strand repeat-containing protein n=1 Tax=Duganella sp. CY15W TaxID=2692172 RepID=UPI00136C0FA8|nr:YDG domain-containing protein [Duganella sp. CY15W]MYM29220.1 filamentous hemagglutinin N-terminal domain-containing protein [Duganella sp. CY15W]
MHKHASANRFYRLVWSHVHACWIVVAETARGRGKSNSTVRAARRLGAVLAGAALAGSALATPPPAVNALPSGAQLAAGQASIATSGNQMTVTQSSSQAIVNWQRFDIGADAAVRFDQPSASAVALNRVIGSDASQIYGKLSSNGSVFLINPQGVLFGASAQVDVGALTASSLNISDRAFLNAQYDYTGSGSAGAVSNAGRIRTASGGYVALVAPSVSNSGSISAPQGSVALAAGEQVSVDLRGDGLIGVRTTRGALQALAQNSGAISADGGQVLLSAAAADALTRATVNNTGIVQARGIVSDGGSIRLVADEVHTGALDVSSSAGKGGAIVVEGQIVAVDGALHADGASGGSIAIHASGNLSAAAAVSANGRSAAGGAVSYVAGNALVENTSSVSSADGATDGGSTTLSAGAGLTSSGTHSARGGSGVGGRIDVSGQQVSLFSGTLDASGATQGGLVRVGGAFQGGTPHGSPPDTERFLARWGQTAAIGNADSVFLNDSSNIDVSARGQTGQGGTAVVWSQQQTTLLGGIKADGVARGGAVEVSSADALRYVNLDKLTLGHGGSLLLDPKNIIISNSASQWTYSEILKGDSALEAGDGSGFGVALSADSTQLAVGAPFDRGATNATQNAGAVRLYTFVNNTFAGAALKGTIGSGYTGNGNVNVSLNADALFGSAVALSGDGKTLAIGAPGQAGGAGAVHAFRFATSGFQNLLANDTVDLGSSYATQGVNGGAIGFGSSLALNSNGSRLAIGALYEGGSAGAVYMFNNDTQGAQSFVPAFAYRIGGAADSLFGTAVALNGTGDRLAVGAINADNGRGKVYLYTAGYSTASQTATLSSGVTGGSNTQVSLLDGEYFGSALAFNASGTRLAVGAPNAPKYGGTTLGSGSVRIYDFADSSYGSPKLVSTVGNGYTYAPDGKVSSNEYDNFGFAVAMNGSGDRLVVGAPYADQAGNAPASGGVYAFSIQNGSNAVKDLGYSATGASGGTTMFSTASLNNLLIDAQTTVTLQASNDITMDAGSSLSGLGSLTLSAGRSIVINGDIGLPLGTVTITANAAKPDASTGPVDKDRDPGSAVLTINGGINARTLNLKLDAAGAYKTNSASGALTVNSVVRADTINVQNLGGNSGNDVVIGAAGQLIAGGSGDAIVAVTKGNGTFTNNALQGLVLAGSGRYLVYSSTPGQTTENLLGYSKHYAQSYTGATPQYAASGNWFLYSVAPTLTVTASSSSKVYDGVIGGINYTATGYIDGDTAGNALTGALGLVNGSKNVGVYNINQGTLADGMGYNLVFSANNAKQTVTPAALTVSVSSSGKVYDGNASAVVNYLSNAVAGDALNLSGTASYADKNAGSGKQISVTGMTLTGADASNYTLSSNTVSTTANITQRTLTVSAAGSDKTYDGRTTAAVTLNDDHLSGDAVTLSSSGAAYADKNAGTGKNITVSGLSMSGTDAGNYKLTSATAMTTGSINTRTLTASATGASKVYDGQTDASVTWSDNRISGDNLVVAAGSAYYADRNVGSNKTITIGGVTLSGIDAMNYALQPVAATTTGAITPRLLTATASSNGKVYDGSSNAVVSWQDDRIAGDMLSYAGNAVYADKNVGVGKDIAISSISLSGASAGNYVLASTAAHTSGNITVRTLDVSVSGGSKVYDGLATASVTLADNRVAGDHLALASAGASYGDKNVGNGKTITVGGLSLSGADAGNYTLASAGATGSGNITPRSLVISATGVDKVYDGTTAATVNYTDNHLSGDNVGFSASAAFGSKDAGSNKGIDIGNVVLNGADAGNYILDSARVTASANIGQRTLTATANGLSKVYDGSANGSATFGDDRIHGDQLTLSATGSAVYADRNAGAAKAISVDGVALSGADARNYVLASTTAHGTGTITQKTVNVSVAGGDKVYDGSTAATVSYSENDHVAGDVLTISGNASFADKNAGTGKSITVRDIALGGADAGNYAVASTSASTTASITQRALTATIASAGKVYDGNTGAMLTFGDDSVSGDMLYYTSNTGSYADKNAGVGKTVSVSGITLSGPDARNYVLSNSSATTTATIAQRALVVTGTGVSKVYDGTTSAQVTFTDNRVNGDALAVGVGSASYADKNVGANKALVFSNASLSGADAANYTLDLSSNSGTGAITARMLNVSATGIDKVYDGTVNAGINYSDNRVAGDMLSYTANAVFGDKNAAANKSISVSGMTLGGADGGNYVLFANSATTQASITPRALVVTATGSNKVYDGSVNAVATLGDDRIQGDVLTVTGGAAAFVNKNAGSHKALTVSDIRLAGADAGNYMLASGSAAGSADITQRDLSFTAAGQDKTYDGSASASVNFSDNRVAGDRFSLSAAANYSDKNAGSGKAVSVSGVTLSGEDAGNYHLTSNSATTTGSISPRALNVMVTGADKVYDGTTAAVVNLSDDRIGGDALEISGGGSFASKNAGVQKLILSDVSLSGGDAGNYTLSVSSSGTATITPRALTANVTAADKVYDGSTAASIALSVNALNGDAVQISGSGVFADKNAGSGKVVNVSGVQLTGADARNYTMNTGSLQAHASITPRSLTASVTASDKVYDGTTAVQFTVADNRLAGDALEIGGSAAFSDKNAGSGKTVTVSGISLGGADARNYTLASSAATTTANIAQKDLVVTADNQTRAFGAVNPALSYRTSGLVAGDSVGQMTVATSANAQSAAGDYAITLAGTDLPNYKVNYVNGSLTVLAPAAPVNNTIGSIVKPVLPVAQGGGLGVPSAPDTPLQQAFAGAGSISSGGGGGNGNGSTAGGNANNTASRNGGPAFSANNNGGSGGANGGQQDEVTTTSLPGGTQIASRNGGIRTAE